MPSKPSATLVIEGLESGSTILVDGLIRVGTEIQLEPGVHDVLVRRFGSLDFEASVEVRRDETTSLRIAYRDAPFEIRSLEASPSSFDPADPGFLGSCVLKAGASARGEAAVTVVDESGRAVRGLGTLAFDGPSARVRWDGRDDEGRALPPGEYRFRVEGSEAEARTRIESGTFARSDTLYSGVSGSLFAPDARSLEPGASELGSGASFHLSPTGGAGLGIAEASLRLGLGGGAQTAASSGGSELDFSYMGVFWQGLPDSDSYSISAAWKLGLGGRGSPAGDGRQDLERSALAAAFYLKGTLARFDDEDPDSSVAPSWDGTTRFSGLSAGLPIELDLSGSRIFAAPEIELSDYYPNWATAGAPFETPGLFAWAYLRMGIEATLSDCTLGLSGALRSAPLGGPFGLAGPCPIGFELKWHSPSSPLVLEFMATGEIEGIDDYYLGAGLAAAYRL
jgi:hypothetical protein